MDPEAGRSIVAESNNDSSQLNKKRILKIGMPSINKKSAKLHLASLAAYTDFRAGGYGLTALKQIKGSTAFMNLADSVKGCQNEQYEECQTRNYLKKVKEQCGCLPWSLSAFVNDKVI